MSGTLLPFKLAKDPRIMPSENPGLGQPIGYSVSHNLVPWSYLTSRPNNFLIQRRETLPRRDTGQMRRVFCCGPVLSKGQVTVSGHGGSAIAPWLLGNKLDYIVIVLPFLFAWKRGISFTVPCSTAVWSVSFIRPILDNLRVAKIAHLYERRHTHSSTNSRDQDLQISPTLTWRF